ncbi:MAG: acyl carrier protein [Clostridia bacterium]|nr:acyl carrier protein [Clostridia bacterium]
MVLEKVIEILSTQFDVAADTITAETDIVDDLGADSLDLVDMLMSLEDEFNIGEVPDEMVEKIRTVGQLVTYIEENM